MIHGARFPFGARFRSSMMANTIPTSNAVPINSSMNGPTGLWKYPDGKVAKMLYDAIELVWPRTACVTCS